MTRVLVTGGAGFIGSHIADALLARGDEVVVVDDFSSGKTVNVPEGVELIEGDLAEPEVAQTAMEGGVEGVVHCAARPSVAASVEDPVTSNRANLEGSTRLLLAARDAGVRRIVYSSSSAVYGGEVDGPSEEGMREAPMSPYGMNKLAAEQLFRMAPGLYGVDTVCLRYFNVYGPRQDPGSPYSGVISLFVTAALDGREPTIYGDGKQSRDFTYVTDIVRANLAALDLETGGGAVFNIGRGESVDLVTVWAAIREACGHPELEAEHVSERVGDIRHSRAAVDRAAETLGFTAEVPLERGLEETVAWYRAPVSSDP
ncbi:MAG: NAD-dependent epimerase/dehydratase family protein [Planctomycetota bacterium]|jgi:UDP-glucose 4-epimerase